MKSYLSSAVALAFGGMILATQLPEQQVTVSYAGEVHVDYQSTPQLRTQQASLRGIRYQDMADVPRRSPVPDGIHISSYYGMRNHPIHKIRLRHTGIDYAAMTGTPVMATAGGIVTESMFHSDSSTYGKHVVINHDDVFSSRYAHLSKVFVEEGQEVELGDTIGLVGSTGVSTNAHLHYEVIKGGSFQNPTRFLK